MDFALTQEHELIREMAYKFGQNEVLPGLADRDREHRTDASLLEKMSEGGIMGISIPAKYGGSDTDYISLGIVCEELERIRCALHGFAPRPKLQIRSLARRDCGTTA